MVTQRNTDGDTWEPALDLTTRERLGRELPLVNLGQGDQARDRCLEEPGRANGVLLDEAQRDMAARRLQAARIASDTIARQRREDRAACRRRRERIVSGALRTSIAVACVALYGLAAVGIAAVGIAAVVAWLFF